MASSYSDLKFELIATGEQSGSWGDTTNANIGTAIEQALVGMATLVTGDFSSNVATLSLTNTTALQNARALCLNITATLSAAGTINVPAIEKPYIIINNSVGGFAVTVKVSGLTGVSVPNGKRTVVYNNGTDIGNQIDYLATLALGTALPISSGGTGSTSTTFVNLATNVTGTLPAANGGTGVTSSTGSGSVVLSNTPTLVTPILGVASATSINKVAFTAPATGSTLTIADGKTLTASNSLTLAGTDSTTMTFPASSATVAGLGVAQTFSATQTLNGSATTLAEILKNAAEPITISATAATGTINFDLLTQSIVYYTTNASGNWTLNLRGDGTTSMNTLLSTGQAVTLVFMAQQGATSYYNNVLQVDGTTVTPKWASSVPVSGLALALDVYTYTVIKTGSAAFTVLANITSYVV